MSAAVFYHVALAVALGMAAQILGAHFSIPSIVLMLLLGAACGPDGLGLLDPRVLAPAIHHLVTLGVTVILFEGALALDLEGLRRQQRSLALLLTAGAGISMLTGTVAAHWLLGFPWPVASLYGAIVIVTGPTVVTPLLARIAVDRKVRDLLVNEGVLIDPVGAVVAIVAAESVLGRSHPIWAAGWLVFVRLGVGAAIGAGAGLFSSFALRRHWIPEGLRNPAVLGAVLLAAALASRISSEAGLMAAVAQGVVMANAGLRQFGRLRQFKEELTVVLLSFLFVLLAANLPLAAVRALGWRALAVVAVLVWFGRPLAVFACTAGSDLDTRERLFVSWICPRGIVAASVAGLFGILLEDAGIGGGDALEALVFITVAATVILQGLSAAPVARALGVDLPTLQGTVIVGADAFGRLIARVLQAHGRQAVLVDANPRYCRAAHREGLPAYQGDALAYETLEEAGIRYADTLLATTRNQELNALVVRRVQENFRVERALAAGGIGEEDGVRQPGGPFPGNFPGVDEVNRWLYAKRGCLIEYEAAGSTEWLGRRLGDLPYGPSEFALALIRRGRAYVATGDQVLGDGDRLVCLAESGEKTGLASRLAVRAQAEAAPPERALGTVAFRAQNGIVL